MGANGLIDTNVTLNLLGGGFDRANLGVPGSVMARALVVPSTVRVYFSSISIHSGGVSTVMVI